MLSKDKHKVRSLRMSWLLLLLISLPLAVIAGGTAQDKRRSQPRPRQELTHDERLEAEQCLAEQGYWTGPVDGTLDPAFRHALIAFQKVTGRPRTGRLTKNELEAVRKADKPLPQDASFAHLEVDLTRQVLFVVDETGSITHILSVCTGNEKDYVDQGQTHRAHTPRGQFKVVRKIAGWRRSTLGLLYYPNYIHEGIAIHGSPAVAAYPASHGCIRIPMFASKELSEITPVGTSVLVYE